MPFIQVEAQAERIKHAKWNTANQVIVREWPGSVMPLVKWLYRKFFGFTKTSGS
jgi:hypothetical protein